MSTNNPNINTDDPPVNPPPIPSEPDQQSSERRASTSSFNSSEWEFVHHEIENPNPLSPRRHTPLPSAPFPGTWSTALSDTSHAARSLTTATLAYTHALTHSGVAKAGFSISSAVASSANRTALSAAAYAVDTMGGRAKVPGPVRKWLGRKERMDEARVRKEEAEKDRLRRKVKAELIARGEVIETPPSARTSRAQSISEGEAGLTSGYSSPDMLSDFPIDRFVEMNAERGLVSGRGVRDRYAGPPRAVERRIESPYTSVDENGEQQLISLSPPTADTFTPAALHHGSASGYASPYQSASHQGTGFATTGFSHQPSGQNTGYQHDSEDRGGEPNWGEDANAVEEEDEDADGQEQMEDSVGLGGFFEIGE